MDRIGNSIYLLRLFLVHNRKALTHSYEIDVVERSSNDAIPRLAGKVSKSDNDQ